MSVKGEWEKEGVGGGNKEREYFYHLHPKWQTQAVRTRSEGADDRFVKMEEEKEVGKSMHMSTLLATPP